MNNFAVSSDGIATALQTSASALMSAGNDLNQSVALVAAANKVLQDPSQVGAALRTIALRIRGTSVEVLEEMGEETDGVVESVSKLQQKIMAISGVNILDESGAYKDTYEILKDLAEVWDEVGAKDPKGQAALLELLAGKNRSNALAAILGNLKDLEGAYEAALQAEGSAQEELDTHLNSIQGRIDKFINAVQTMWMNMISSDLIKQFVDLGTLFINLIDKLGLIGTLSAVVFGTALYKGISRSVKAAKASVVAEEAVATATASRAAADAAAAKAAQAKAAASAMAASSDTTEAAASAAAAEADILEAEASKAAAKADIDEAAASKASAAADAAEKSALSITDLFTGVGIKKALGKVGKGISKIWTSGLFGKTTLVGIGATLAVGAIKLIKTHFDKQKEELNKQVQEMSESYINAKKTLESNIKSLEKSSNPEIYDTLEDEFKILASGVDEYGNNISLTSEQYERYQSICEQIVGIQPSIAEGYDSATRAINNNANALSQLIELQKAEARFNAKELTSDDNLSSILKDAKNTLKDTKKNTSMDKFAAMQARDMGLNNVIESLPDSFWMDVLDIDAVSVMDAEAEIDKTKLHSKVRDQIAKSDKDITEILRGFLDSNKVNQEIKDQVEFAIRDIDNITSEYQSELNFASKHIEEAQNALIDVLLQVPSSIEKYDDLSISSKSLITEWIKNSDNFKIDETTTESQVLQMKQAIKDMVYKISEEVKITLTDGTETVLTGQDILDRIFEINPSTINYAEYRSKINELFGYLWKILGIENDTETQKQIKIALGIDFDVETKDGEGTKNNKIRDDIARVTGMTSEDAQKWLDSQSAATVKALINVDWSAKSGMTVDQVLAEIQSTLPVEETIQHYSILTESISKTNDVISQMSDLFIDNIEITAEQGDALKELIGKEEEYSEAIDDSNGYIVKNADLLKQLVKRSKEQTSQNIKTYKSQARLKYYELYKEMRKLAGANGELAQKNKEQINLLYKEMQTVAKTIQKYSLLEEELLGVTNAYKKFEDAQTLDDANNYDEQISNMVVSLGNALNSGEFSEQSWAALEGLIPSELFEDLDTAEAKMQKVYDLFTKGPISTYFTLEFDDEGSIQSAEITRDNIKKFVEDGINGTNAGGIKVFDGTWDNFDLSENITSLQDLADAYGMTKEAVFAYLKEMEKYDISPIDDKFTTFLDKLMSEDLDYKLFEQTGAAAKALNDVANGVDGAAQKYADAQLKLAESFAEARDRFSIWKDANDGYEDAVSQVNEITKEIEKQKKLGVDASSLERELDFALSEMGKYAQIMQENEISELIIQASIDDVQKEIDTIDKSYADLANHVEFNNETGKYNLKSEVVWNGDTPSQETIDNYLSLLNEKHSLEIVQGEGVPTVLSVLEEIEILLRDITKLLGGVEDGLEKVTFKDWIINIGANISDTLKTWWDRITNGTPNVDVTVSDPGGATSDDTKWKYSSYSGRPARAGGSPGLKSAEHNSLVGELGTETVVDPHKGIYYTVGENGAEFVDLPKDAIVFNHEQTEELFKNGHINSRGKAFAQGNAHAITTWNTGVGNIQSDWVGSTSLNDSAVADTLSDIDDDFEELFDWIEILVEEIDEQISLMEAQLENSVGIDSKKGLYSSLVSAEYAKIDAYTKGIGKYQAQANKFLSEIPARYREMAKNGAIEITEFKGEVNEKVVEAINNYREWAQKAADLNQQLEETKSHISDLRVETQGMISTEYDNKIGLITHLNDTLEAEMGLLEESGKRTSEKFYTEMIKNGESQLKLLQQKRDAMQTELNSAVKSGDVEKYSDDWYEMVNAIYEVDAAVIDCETSIEGFNNSIQELHWENFEKIIDEIHAVSDEAEQLRDLIDDADITETSDPEKWSKDGVTALGLVAQQMENAQYRSELYAKEIEYLNKEFKSGKYTQDEYNEKLKELKDNQWDAIDAYESAKDAIIDLNKTRVDAIKDGIQKEIDAYEELINKRKEDLDAQKDTHDWANTVADHTKNIDTIQRQIDAMEGDTSAAAAAQRKKLEEELAAAQEEYDEALYDRSIETQQQSLDKSLEIYRQEQEAKMEELDAWLLNEEQVIAESYAIISANTEAIHSNIEAISDKYGIEIENNVVNPWTAGITALGTYATELDTSTSQYVEMLRRVRQELIDLQLEADSTAASIIKATNASSKSTEAAVKDPPKPKPTTPSRKPSYSSDDDDDDYDYSGNISRGQQVIVNSDATNFTRDGGNGGTRMHDWVPGSSFTVMETKGDEVLIGIPGEGYTGWVDKDDLTAKYAKGTTGVKNNQLAWIDENGLEEIVMHADNGRLTYLTKGSAVLPHDISENLMELGKVDPKTWLENNRKTTIPTTLTTNNNVIELNVGEIIHVEHMDRDSLPEIQEAIQKQLNNYMKQINGNLKKYTR